MAEIEAELARLRDVSIGGDARSHQRTSVMTHVAWVPPEWLGAAWDTLEDMEARHPSRTVILVPEPASAGGIDVELALRCFPVGDREICGEVIELHLRGDRARSPASIVVPLAIADLPLFLRWRGEPPFVSDQWRELVDLADRVIVDTSEWDEPRPAELAGCFTRSAISDLAWARIHPWRVALARRWPAIRTQSVAVSGPRAEALLLRGWLSARLGRALPGATAGADLSVALDGEPVAPADELVLSPGDFLSAELDRSGRDAIYEEAVHTLAAEATNA